MFEFKGCTNIIIVHHNNFIVAFLVVLNSFYNLSPHALLSHKTVMSLINFHWLPIISVGMHVSCVIYKHSS